MSSPPPSAQNAPSAASQPRAQDPAQAPAEAALAETRPHAGSAAGGSAPSARSVDPLIGQCVRAYRIVRELGRGGMGVVYQAEHIDIGQRAAVKTLNLQRLGGAASDPSITQRFLTEAKALAIARHPGLVNIFDYGQLPDGTLFLLMEYLEGESLADRRDRPRPGPPSPTPTPTPALPMRTAVRVTRQIADALVAAHEKGIFHRDLKPSNVFLVPDSEAPSGERVKILDFGLARIRAVTQGDGPDGAAAGKPTDRTSTSLVMGTPLYMAPEQCRGLALADGQSDVYSLGVMLYELLTGAPPFTADTSGDLIAMHIYRLPTSLDRRTREAPRPLVDLVMRMLRKDPVERPSMAVVSRALRSIEAMNLSPQLPSQTSRRSRGPGGIAIGLFVILLGLILVSLYAWLVGPSNTTSQPAQPAAVSASPVAPNAQPAAPAVAGAVAPSGGASPAAAPPSAPASPAPTAAASDHGPPAGSGSAPPSADPTSPDRPAVDAPGTQNAPAANATTLGANRTASAKDRTMRARAESAGTGLGMNRGNPTGSTRSPGSRPVAPAAATAVAPPAAITPTAPPKTDEEVHVPALR